MKQLFYYRKKIYTLGQRTILILLVLSAMIIATSCTKEEEINDESNYAKLLQNSNSAKVTTHRWFYFTQDGFKETDIPRNAPPIEPSPWTQAIRVTASAFINDDAYFTINKLGLLQSPQTFGFQKDGIASEAKLIKNVELFSKATVADIYCIDKKPVINFFTNTIFEENISNPQVLQDDDPFLLTFDTKSYEYLPLLSKKSLSERILFDDVQDILPSFSALDIREVFFQNDEWNILLKSNQVGKTDFYALAFSSKEDITDTSNQSLQTTTLSINEYRETTRPQKSFDLPKKIQELLAPVPTRISYYLNYSEENSPSSTQYEHLSNNTKPIQGYALGFDHCSIAIFEDGTICFAGSLPSKSVINNGETKAFKLPDLGPGYVYGPMSLSGSTLIVSWEETSFFETGASGFLAVDMEQVLYQDSTLGA